MKHLFSPRKRVGTWRQLWVWLMESQKELGLPITDEALAQMQANVEVKDEEFPIAAKEEARRRYVFVLSVLRFATLVLWFFMHLWKLCRGTSHGITLFMFWSSFKNSQAEKGF